MGWWLTRLKFFQRYPGNHAMMTMFALLVELLRSCTNVQMFSWDHTGISPNKGNPQYARWKKTTSASLNTVFLYLSPLFNAEYLHTHTHAHTRNDMVHIFIHFGWASYSASPRRVTSRQDSLRSSGGSTPTFSSVPSLCLQKTSRLYKAHLVVLQETVKQWQNSFFCWGSEGGTGVTRKEHCEHCTTARPPHCTGIFLRVGERERHFVCLGSWPVWTGQPFQVGPVQKTAAAGCIDAQILWSREPMVYMWVYWYNKNPARVTIGTEAAFGARTWTCDMVGYRASKPMRQPCVALEGVDVEAEKQGCNSVLE